MPRRSALLGLLSAALVPSTARADIPRVQKIGTRVRPQLREQYAKAGVSYPPKRILLRVFKHERRLQLWASGEPDEAMTQIESFDVCAASGELGPKRRYGDEQVPEGVYAIHRYNGWSGFHMSLRVNYPNASDRIRGRKESGGALGGAIMVHGGCASIGCVAILNGPIERVFVAALDAHRTGRQRPTIHILPTHFDDEGWARLRARAAEVSTAKGERLMTLWRELADVDAAFQGSKTLPTVDIDDRGAYVVEQP